MGVVPTLAPVLGGVLHAAFGWRAIFLAMVAFGLALGATVQARLPETIPVRSHAPLSFLAILRGFGHLLRHPGYRIYVALTSLAYGGLFAFISGSSFVLQGVFGLSVLQYAVSFGFVVIGFIAGTWLAQKAVARVGLDRTIRLGVALLAGAGVLMLLLVLARLPSSLAVTLPMALYGAGVGLTMPQTVAAAMMPFPDRAGAASSLLGICQMTFAAVLGIGLGQALETSPLPMPLLIAGAGVTALVLFLASARARQA